MLDVTDPMGIGTERGSGLVDLRATPLLKNGQGDSVHFRSDKKAGRGSSILLNPDSYLRLTSALRTNLSSLSDAQVAPYADNYFQYNSNQRVTQETVQGAGSSGLGTYTFSYTPSTNPTGFNSWAMSKPGDTLRNF